MNRNVSIKWVYVCWIHEFYTYSGNGRSCSRLSFSLKYDQTTTWYLFQMIEHKALRYRNFRIKIFFRCAPWSRYLLFVWYTTDRSSCTKICWRRQKHELHIYGPLGKFHQNGVRLLIVYICLTNRYVECCHLIDTLMWLYSMYIYGFACEIAQCHMFIRLSGEW